jgi:hypothetical protein
MSAAGIVIGFDLADAAASALTFGVKTTPSAVSSKRPRASLSPFFCSQTRQNQNRRQRNHAPVPPRAQTFLSFARVMLFHDDIDVC